MLTTNETPTTSAKLVDRARSGDDEAARELVVLLYPLVLRLVRSHRPRRTEEDDLCQIVFARIFHRLEQYQGAVPLEHWVSRITINACLNTIQAERIRPELRHADLSDEQVEVVSHLLATSAEVPDARRDAAHELVSELLGRLKPQERLIITLLHLEERTLDEICDITGWSRTLAKVRAFRARQKLKNLYRTLVRSTPP